MKHFTNPYILSIAAALAIFPFIAILITLPFTISNYRKYGGISVLKTIVFYSFVLYILCMFLLTALPLPSRKAVLLMDPIGINWRPFSNLMEGLEHFGMTSSPSTWTNVSIWLQYLRSNMFFQILANIIMTIPLGIYLRYYFGLNLKKTVLIGFLTSLFLEVTQLTGLWFIYPRPYRCPDVNDLMVNTLGCYIGYLITPLLTFFLPDKEELAMISWRKGEKVTFLRQIVAAIVDWIIIFFAAALYSSLLSSLKSGTPVFDIGIEYYFPISIVYLVVVQWFLNGNTLGKSLVRIKLVSTKANKKPNILNYLIRYLLIYFIIPIGVAMAMLALVICMALFLYDNAAMFRIIAVTLTSLGFLLVIYITYRIYKNHHLSPWDYFSKSKVIVGNRPANPKQQ